MSSWIEPFDRARQIAWRPRDGAWLALALALSCGGILLADDRPADAVTHDAGPVAAAPLSAGSAASSIGQTTAQHVAELIRQLGSPRFVERRSASRELRQIGAEAFDLLNAAADDTDPEVAASARYLLRQITVRWVHSGDSAAVRVLLRDYGKQPDEMRTLRIDALAALPEGEGLAALCRIARFDRSSRISRQAALGVIRSDTRAISPTSIDPEVVNHELGTSTRAASAWLRTYLVQLRDPAASVAVWQQLVDDEASQLEANADETSAQIVLGLLWNLAELHRGLDQHDALVATLDRMIQLDADSVDETALELLPWLTDHKLWQVLDGFLTKHAARFEHSKRPMYYAAIARAREQKPELAEELAKKAAALDPQTPLDSFLAAKDLEEHSQFEWAVREYQRSIDKEPIASQPGILARVYLANLLQDYEQYERAAGTLEPLVKAVQGDGRIGQLYTNLRRRYSRDGDSVLPEAEALAARLRYNRACLYRQQEDWARVREELELAIRFDPNDADVLIMMYRLPDADETWRQATLARIRELERQFQQQIDEDPSDPTPYNQWAWLVSNTEGDYQKAIRYSRRSVELNTSGDSAAASYLDTLARCYYAAGDLENAVQSERQAIAKVGYMQVMQRQLAQFEKALAEQQPADK